MIHSGLGLVKVFYICQDDGRQDRFMCPTGTLFSQNLSICDFRASVHCPAYVPTPGPTSGSEVTQRTTTTKAARRGKNKSTEISKINFNGGQWGAQTTSKPIPAGIDQAEVRAPRVIESTLQGGFKEESSRIESDLTKDVEPSTTIHLEPIQPGFTQEDQSTSFQISGDVEPSEDNIPPTFTNGPVQLGEIQIPDDLEPFSEVPDDLEPFSEVPEILEPPSVDYYQPTFTNGAVQLGEIQIPDDWELFLKNDYQQSLPAVEVPEILEPPSVTYFQPTFANDAVQLGEIQILDDLQQPSQPVDNVEPSFEDVPQLRFTNEADQLGGIQIPEDLEPSSKDNLEDDPQQPSQPVENVEPSKNFGTFEDIPQPTFANEADQFGGIQIPEDLEPSSTDNPQQFEAKVHFEEYFQPTFTNEAVQLGQIQIPNDPESFSNSDHRQNQPLDEFTASKSSESSSDDTFQSASTNKKLEHSAEDNFLAHFMREQDLLAIIDILKDVEPSSENRFPSQFMKGENATTAPITEDVEPSSPIQRIQFPDDPELSTEDNLPTEETEPLSEYVEATVQPDLIEEEPQSTQIYDIDSDQFVTDSPTEVIDEFLSPLQI